MNTSTPTGTSSGSKDRIPRNSVFTEPRKDPTGRGAPTEKRRETKTKHENVPPETTENQSKECMKNRRTDSDLSVRLTGPDVAW